jgi:hypothetical protein
VDRPGYCGVPVVGDWVKGGSGIGVSHEVLEVRSGEKWGDMGRGGGNLGGGGGGIVRVATYEFGKLGRVVHIVPNLSAREGLDEMFTAYQTQDIPFRRYRMHTGKGTYPRKNTSLRDGPPRCSSEIFLLEYFCMQPSFTPFYPHLLRHQ